MRQWCIAVASLVLAASAKAQEPKRLGSVLDHQYPMQIGTKLEAVTVVGPNGHVTVDPRKAKETVLIFISYSCPYSQGYNDYMHTLYNDYTSKGVQIAFLNANHEDAPYAVGQDDPGAWRKNLQTDTTWGGRLPPSYLDSLSEVANMVGAVNTPEVYIFDSTGTLRYRGAPTAEEDKSKDYTRWALDALLAGKPVAIQATPTFGCMIHSISPDGSE